MCCLIPWEFKTAIGTARDFKLRFDNYVSAITWDQLLSKATLSNIRLDMELPSLLPGAYTDAAVGDIAGRSTLKLAVSRPFAAEISGREDWFGGFDGFARLDHYTYKLPTGSQATRRVPISGFDAITVSPGALRFDTVLTSAIEPQTKGLTIKNGGPVPLVINSITVPSASPFTVLRFQGPVAIPRGVEFEIAVRFAPVTEGCVTGVLTISTNGGSSSEVLMIDVSGTGTTVEKDARPDPRGAAERKFLAALNLDQVVLDAEAPENPAAIFPTSLLRAALNAASGQALTCVLRLPMQLVTVDCSSAADALRMDDARGADLAFMQPTDGQQYVCNMVSHPTLVGAVGSLQRAFVLRQTRLATGESLSPSIGGVCTVHRVYRQTMQLPAVYVDDPTQAPSPKRPGKLAVAISVHRDPPQHDEANSLVSTSDPVPLPGRKPAAPDTAKITLPEPSTWSDPFLSVYSSLPKMLDNRWVVHCKLPLSDASVMQNKPLHAADGEYEVYRAPEDALRVELLHRPRASDDTIDTFNNLTPGNRYERIVRRLIGDWEDRDFTLRGAFKLVGKARSVATAPNDREFVDEIDEVGAGNVFYAVRKLQNGVPSSDLSYLPFRVIVPDVTPPGVRAVNRLVSPDGVERRIQWPLGSESDLYAYEFVSASRTQIPLQTLYVSSVTNPTGGRLAQKALRELVPTVRTLRVERRDTSQLGRVELMFGIQALGIPDSNSILGIYATEGGPTDRDLALHDFKGDPKNLWVPDVSQVAASQRTLEGIDLTHNASAVLVWRDQGGSIRTLRAVTFYTLGLDGIAIEDRSTISGIYPIAPLRVVGDRVPLLFDSSIHGISSTNQINGVYRAYPDPANPTKDGGYGSAISWNHWARSGP
ncbi:MAG: hypothetical protein IPG76_00115 [Acidobacteria bacterium]|nr:hypothetical protein [Acidobacteriota bacterium]